MKHGIQRYFPNLLIGLMINNQIDVEMECKNVCDLKSSQASGNLKEPLVEKAESP